MEFEQIVAPTIKELFIERIEGMIFSGALKPGDRLPPERELAAQMKISRTIVHLGMEDLARRGFVEILPRQGVAVADFAEKGNLETLNDILRYNGGKLEKSMVVSIIELRDAIEGGALIRLGRNHTDADMAELHALMAEFTREAERTREVPAVAAALARFHYKICTISGNRLFPLILNAFRGVGRVLWESSVRFWGPETLLKQGNAIIGLLEKGQGEEAAAYLSSLFAYYLDNT